MVTSNGTWQAPGPGMWEMDEAHQSAPYSAYMLELFRTRFNLGISEASERYGTLIDRFDMRPIDGWIFARMRIVGAPEKPGPLPPKWLFKLLFRLHPALRRRRRAAAEAVDTLRWRQDGEWWVREAREPMRARAGALQAIDLAPLSDEMLADHMREVEAALTDGLRIHLRNSIAHWIGVGDWLASVSEWTGATPDEALPALQGSSPYSTDTIAYLERIAAAVRRSPAAAAALARAGDAEARSAAMRSADPGVAEALDAYLAEHGWRIYTGFDIADKAMIELPENLLDSIAAQLDSGSAKVEDTSVAAALRARVPAAHLAEYDLLFETACLLYGVRDDDAGPSVHWTLGLMRRVLLEVGARAVRSGCLETVDHIFEATPSEVGALLAGRGVVTAREMAGRAARREASAANRPPARLGEDEGPPPPDDWMPPAIARVNRALMTAMSVEYAPPVEESPGEDAAVLRGLAASGGVYEGRACVVEGPDDFAKLQKGDVLVVPFTTTAYNVVLPILGGVVTNKGGVLSHAAIVAREYAIPAVVNTGNGTSMIPDGARIRVNGTEGRVTVLSPATAAARPEAQVT